MNVKFVKYLSTKTLLKLIELQKKCLPNDEAIMPTTEQYWWMVYEEKEPIAFACMQPSIRWDNTVYFSRCGVIYKYRGNGIQKCLITERINKAKRLGFEWAITDTTDNIPSSNSLISCGFKMFEPSIKWASENSIYWKYKI